MGMAKWEDYPNTVGCFRERSVGGYHEYSRNTDLEFAQDFPHKLWTLDGFRYARILKTVAYICVDEDEYGNPVEEKWDISSHKFWEAV